MLLKPVLVEVISTRMASDRRYGRRVLLRTMYPYLGTKKFALMAVAHTKIL